MASKKQVNAIELSNKAKSKRNLHLNGLSVQLRMAYDAYKTNQDYQSEGAITKYRKPGVHVFEKTSESRMRFGLAARSAQILIGDGAPPPFDLYCN